MQGTSAEGMDENMQKVERGLTQDQTEILHEMLKKVKDKYNSNNLQLLIVDKQINMLLEKKGIKYQSKAAQVVKLNEGDGEGTPRFDQ